jgi:hypothetical protein
MTRHLDHIRRPVHVGDTVTHRVSHEEGVVTGFLGKNRVLVRTSTGDACWYTDSTML